MSFFNKKEDVLEVELSPHGRYLLSIGKLKPAFYAFMDDDVLYDTIAATGSLAESNHEVKNRILAETPSLKPQRTFVNSDSRLISGETNPTNDITHMNHYTLGTSNGIEEFTPAWEVSMIRNEISSSVSYLSSSYGYHNIPQVNVDIEYTISIGSPDDSGAAIGLAPSADLQVGEPFNDGTFLKIEPEQALLRILEKNGFLHAESLTIEAFKEDSDFLATPIIDKALHMPSTVQSIQGIMGTPVSTYPSSGFLSLSFWCKLDEFSASSPDNQFIVEADNASNLNIFIIDFQRNKLRVRIFAGDNTTNHDIRYSIELDSTTLSTWSHYTIIINIESAEEPPTGYINAIPISFTKVFNGNNQTGQIGQIAGNIILMANDSVSSVAELKGSLQHFAFYNKALSSTEVNEIYNSRYLVGTSLQSDIIDYWQLGNEEEFNSFGDGDSVTNGLVFDATIGTTSLTINENIFINQGVRGVIKDSETKLVPLKFSKQKELIVNDIMIEAPDVQRDDFNPYDVEYFFDVRVDKQIPLNDICEGVRELKSSGITGDFEVECPDVGNNIDVNIYTSPVTEEDIEECES